MIFTNYRGLANAQRESGVVHDPGKLPTTSRYFRGKKVIHTARLINVHLNPNRWITMKPLKNTCLAFACAALLFGHFGCTTTESLLTSTAFSESAYKADQEIKADSLALIDRAKNRAPYTGVAADVDQLMAKVDQAITSEQGRTKNTPTVEQWKKIKAQLSNLFGLWKTKGSLSPAFVEDAKSQVGALFDILIKTENDKRTQS
jgi:hypothetical protein